MSEKPNPTVSRADMRTRLESRLKMKRIELDETNARVQSLRDQISLLDAIIDDVVMMT